MGGPPELGDEDALPLVARSRVRFPVEGAWLALALVMVAGWLA